MKKEKLKKIIWDMAVDLGKINGMPVYAISKETLEEIEKRKKLILNVIKAT